MRDDASHAASVDAWLERAARDLPPALLVDLFEAALSRVWNRTELTLGSVTLSAIADRVVHDARESFPILSSLTVESNGGIHFEQLRQRATEIDRVALEDGLRFVVCELLTVLGNLTAEVLTPELHAELTKVEIKGKRA